MRKFGEANLVPLDPEIEKTCRRNRQKVRGERNHSIEMAGNNDDALNNLNPNLPGIVNPNEAEVGNEAPRRMRVKDYIMPSYEGIHSSIARPAIGANNFKVDSATLQMIGDNKFNGLPLEDPNAHLRNFLEIVDNFKVNGVPEDTIRLRLFKFSLEGRAKEWLDSLPGLSITTWNQLVEKFLNKYFSPAKTEKYIKDIQNFQQAEMDSLYEAWERFKDLLRRCPHHGFSDQQQIRIFYNGLTIPSMLQVDGAARGSLLNQYPEDAFQILEDLTSNNYRAYERTPIKKLAGVHEVDHLATFSEKIVSQFEALNKRLDRISLGQNQPIQQVQNVAVICEHCGEGHLGSQCTLVYHDTPFSETVNFVGNQNHQQSNPYSNTYNPGWRNHPNFSWSNNQASYAPVRPNAPPGFQQQSRQQVLEKKPTTEELLLQYIQKNEAVIQSQSASLRALETQIGQLANAIHNRPQGALPGDTQPPPRKDNQNEQCNSITLRSGKEIEGNPNTSEEVSSKRTTLPIEENSKEQTDKPANEHVQEENKQGHKLQEVPKPVYPPPPFPQRLQKSKLDKQFQRFLDMFKKLTVNIPFAEALEQTPSYVKFMKEILSNKRRLGDYETVALTEECSAILENKLPPKLKDPGSFNIPCSIGTQFSGKALCDLGASINLMPWSIYKRLGLGEAKPTSVSLQLANRTLAFPRGIVEDVLVKVGKFIFPADFIILDMEEDKEIPIILGRPFLATGRTTIDVQSGELTMRVQDEKVTFKVFSAIKFPSDTEECLAIKLGDEVVEKARVESMSYKLHNEGTKAMQNSGIIEQKFEPGQRVLLNKSCLKLFPCKLKTRWPGQLNVKKVLSSGMVELIDENTGKTFRANRKRLKHHWEKRMIASSSQLLCSMLLDLKKSSQRL